MKATAMIMMVMMMATMDDDENHAAGLYDCDPNT